MNFKFTRVRLSTLWMAVAVGIIISAYFQGYQSLREIMLGKTVTERTLHEWWIALVCVYALLFLVSASVIVAIFRKMLDWHALNATIANIFVVWLLFALASITSDPITTETLAGIGLASLSVWISSIAIMLIGVSLYLLFASIDNARVSKSRMQGGGRPTLR